MDYAIDRSGPVLVTGATGFVAGWIIRRLLEEGVTVHATVRDPGNAGRLRHLNALPRAHGAELRFFGADLLGNGSFAVFHAGRDLGEQNIPITKRCIAFAHFGERARLLFDDAAGEFVDCRHWDKRNGLLFLQRVIFWQPGVD